MERRAGGNRWTYELEHDLRVLNVSISWGSRSWPNLAFFNIALEKEDIVFFALFRVMSTYIQGVIPDILSWPPIAGWSKNCTDDSCCYFLYPFPPQQGLVNGEVVSASSRSDFRGAEWPLSWTTWGNFVVASFDSWSVDRTQKRC